MLTMLRDFCDRPGLVSKWHRSPGVARDDESCNASTKHKVTMKLHFYSIIPPPFLIIYSQSLDSRERVQFHSMSNLKKKTFDNMVALWLGASNAFYKVLFIFEMQNA